MTSLSITQMDWIKQMYLTQGFTDSDSVAIAGGFRSDYKNQWRFVSNTQRGNGRKAHDTVDAAIPRGFNGYIVDAPSISRALALTKGYRDGVQWADQDAADGLIRIVRNGSHMTRTQNAECVHVTTHPYLYPASYVDTCRRALAQNK